MVWLTEKYRKKEIELEKKFLDLEMKYQERERFLEEAYLNRRESLSDKNQELKNQHYFLMAKLEARQELSKELSAIEDIRVACKDVLIEALREQIRGLLPHGNQSVVQTLLDDEKSKESVNKMLKNG